MDFDYFYKEQSDQYAFYRIPKALIVEAYFQDMSTDAKLLYGLLLDRVSLSTNSGWIDEQGRVYIIYTISSITRDLHCGSKKAVRLLRELEKYGMVEKVARGQGKPSLIYVKNFSTLWSKQQFKDGQNDNSRVVERTILEGSKQQSNNTNINNTNINNTNPILSGADVDNSDREAYQQYLYKQLEIEILMERYPYEQDVIESIVNLMLDTICSKRKTIRIAGDDKPVNVVKSMFLKLDASHVEYVIDCLKQNTTKVRNIKQYLLAALYNAPLTMSSYYQAEVNHDFPQYAKNAIKNVKTTQYDYSYKPGESL